jgi:hypothetical protein
MFGPAFAMTGENYWLLVEDTQGAKHPGRDETIVHKCQLTMSVELPLTNAGLLELLFHHPVLG